MDRIEITNAKNFKVKELFIKSSHVNNNLISQVLLFNIKNTNMTKVCIITEYVPINPENFCDDVAIKIYFDKNNENIVDIFKVFELIDEEIERCVNNFSEGEFNNTKLSTFAQDINLMLYFARDEMQVGHFQYSSIVKTDKDGNKYAKLKLAQNNKKINVMMSTTNSFKNCNNIERFIEWMNQAKFARLCLYFKNVAISRDSGTVFPQIYINQVDYE